MKESDPGVPHIIIIGAGFGGLFCAKGLSKACAKITLIDYKNHHLFQPLLYQVATGFLGLHEIATPLRELFKKQNNIEILMEKVIEIIPYKKEVRTHLNRYTYDFLVVATGAQYHFFGQDKWAKYVHTLKSLEDAILLRNNILKVLEEAVWIKEKIKRDALLTYIIIGGGPTGVELAGSITDLIHYILKNEFSAISLSEIKIILIEAGPCLLANMPKSLSDYAKKSLEERGVEVRCNAPVTDIQKNEIKIGEEQIGAHTIIWAAGIKPTSLTACLSGNENRGVKVNENLSVENFNDIFVIGDASICMSNGRPLPALASVAKQQGKYIAKLLYKKLQNQSFKNFEYHDLGTMAIIRRHSALAHVNKVVVTGWLAWLLWGFVHIYFLIGFRQRFWVALTWLWTYTTHTVDSRIILKLTSKKE